MMSTFGIALALFWIVWSITNADIAHQKGRSIVQNLVFSLLCTPLIDWLYLVAVPPLPKKEKAPKS
jgi:hypothetical protein